MDCMHPKEFLMSTPEFQIYCINCGKLFENYLDNKEDQAFLNKRINDNKATKSS